MHLRQRGHDFTVYQTSNMILINATSLLVHFCIMSKFCVLFYVYVYVLYELFFFIDNVVRLLFYVNRYVCHVFFYNKLTYLLTTVVHTAYLFVRGTSLDIG